MQWRRTSLAVAEGTSPDHGLKLVPRNATIGDQGPDAERIPLAGD
jgi:hypothetical protein